MAGIASALGIIELATTTIKSVSDLIKTATAENRDVTADELATVKAADDQAKSDWQATLPPGT